MQIVFYVYGRYFSYLLLGNFPPKINGSEQQPLYYLLQFSGLTRCNWVLFWLWGFLWHCNHMALGLEHPKWLHSHVCHLLRTGTTPRFSLCLSMGWLGHLYVAAQNSMCQAFWRLKAGRSQPHLSPSVVRAHHRASPHTVSEGGDCTRVWILTGVFGD